MFRRFVCINKYKGEGMGDILFLTDEHMGCNNGNKLVFETQMEFYEKQLFPFILKNNIKYVISLGDITDKRDHIDLYILQEIFYDDKKISIKYSGEDQNC